MVEAGDVVGVRLVGHFGAEHLPLLLQHVTQRFNKLDAVILGWVVRGGDHDADPFALERARAEGGDEADAREDRVEDVATVVSVRVASKGKGQSHALVRNYVDALARALSMEGREREREKEIRQWAPTPAVPYVYCSPSGAGCFAAAATIWSDMLRCLLHVQAEGGRSVRISTGGEGQHCVQIVGCIGLSLFSASPQLAPNHDPPWPAVFQLATNSNGASTRSATHVDSTIRTRATAFL